MEFLQMKNLTAVPARALGVSLVSSFKLGSIALQSSSMLFPIAKAMPATAAIKTAVVQFRTCCRKKQPKEGY